MRRDYEFVLTRTINTVVEAVMGSAYLYRDVLMSVRGS